MKSSRRIVAIVLVVSFSVILPMMVVYSWIVPFVTDKPWGFRSNEFKGYYGTVKNGELWFATMKLSPEIIAKDRTATSSFAPSFDYKIKRLDLSTGSERDTGLVPNGPHCILLWMNDELYIDTGSGIYKSNGPSLEKIAESPSPLASLLSKSMHSVVFVYDDQLTAVIQMADGGFRLTHLVEGNWVLGRRVRFPKNDRVWYHNVQTDRTALLPISSKQPALSTVRTKHAAKPSLQVIQHGQQTHLLISVYPDFSAYRYGFEFVDEELAEASALSPENSVHEVSGWEVIQSIGNRQEIFDRMTCDRDGPLFLSWGDRASRCVRRHVDGHWATLTNEKSWGQLFADPSESTAYIVQGDGSYDVAWGRVTVSRIENNVIQPPHLKTQGFMNEYLARWQRLRIGLFFAWMLHFVVVIVGTEWCIRSASPATLFFGDQRAVFASTWRRSLALLFDLLIVLTIVFLFAGLLENSPQIDIERQCNALFQFESQPEKAVFSTMLGLFPESPGYGRSFMCMIALSGLFLALRITQEGRFGTTPGKWLFGIRTVRTTLRPCGIANSLLRTLLYWIDIPNLITPLPMAISMILSPNHQRLGDRIAGTVVIRAGSIRNEDRQTGD